MKNAFEPNWKVVSEKIATQVWARMQVNTIEREFIEAESYLTIPSPIEPSEWPHYYVDNETGRTLTWDPRSPHLHRCPGTDRFFSGDPYDGAWRTMMHNCNAQQAERAAILFRIGVRQSETRAALERIFDFYSENYVRYAVHGHRTGKGKVLSQGLEEAEWIVRLMRSLRWSGLWTEWKPVRRVQIEEMARAVIELLRPQIGEIHNIHVWMLAAMAECASLLGDDELLDWCWNNPVGMLNQILHGFDNDGLWFEGSTTYHFYTLTAVLTYFEAAGTEWLSRHQSGTRPLDYDAMIAWDRSSDLSERLRRSFDVPLELAYANGLLPAYNDGWPEAKLWSYSHLYEKASALLPWSVDAGMLAEVYRSANGSQLRGKIEALLYGPIELPPSPPVRSRSVLLNYSGIGVLKNKQVRLALRFGPYGHGHDHLDKLAVDIETATGWQSLDLGTSAYGATFTRDWQKTSAAHNGVVIDGLPQNGCAGHLLEWNENRITAMANASYSGVMLKRSLMLHESGWDDIFEIRCDHARCIDWFFHGDGVFQPEGLVGKPVKFEEGNGYHVLQNLHEVSAPERLRGSWMSDSVVIFAEWDLPKGMQLFWGEAPGNPNGKPLGIVMLRCTSERLSIRARMGFEKEDILIKK